MSWSIVWKAIDKFKIRRTEMLSSSKRSFNVVYHTQEDSFCAVSGTVGKLVGSEEIIGRQMWDQSF